MVEGNSPYIGLRPFERQEAHLLFGRDEDARLLANKIFSGRWTVFYGVSGRGKSSLLRAKVIPALEDDQAQAILFDAWAGEAPLHDLREALAAHAEKVGVPSPRAGSPSLKDLTRLILAADDRTCILVLDQFEEFLINQQTNLDPMKKELAALIRDSALDIRIVVSLREEFLAALEPFRTDVVSLFTSTYRLAPLGRGSDPTEAITGPARLFGKTYAPALLERLLMDLRDAAGRGPGSHAVEPGLDLPMLQLICSRIWDAAEQRGDETLDLALYADVLGGRDQILSDYVHAVMPKRARDQVLVARLLTSLAPPSGLKLSFSVDDLAQISDAKPARVEAALKQLASDRVLRTRKYGRAERYEVQHDALIDILRPWRDRVLRRIRQARWVRIASASLCAVIALGLGSFVYVERREAHIYYENTEGHLAALLELPPGMDDSQRAARSEDAFDAVAGYLLWHETGPERFDEMRRLFTEYEHLMPAKYGIDTSGLDTLFPSIPADQDWPLTLTYSTDRALNDWYVNLSWEDMAKFFSDLWGFPVPRRIKLIASPNLPKDEVEIAAPGQEPLSISIPTFEHHPFIRSDELQGPEAAFFDFIADERFVIEGVDTDAEYFHVPRWTLPIWKITGNIATDGSGAVAFKAALELQKRPTVLIPGGIGDALINRVPAQFRSTMQEARAAREGRLIEDLWEIIKLGRGLKNLPTILDFAAEHPDAASEDLAARVDEQMGIAEIYPGGRFAGPWPDASEADIFRGDENDRATRVAHALPPVAQQKDELQNDAPEEARTPTPIVQQQAYQEVIGWLPDVETRPIRVFLGAELSTEANDADGWPQVQKAVEGLRDWHWERHGQTLPGVRFIDEAYALPDHSFRIEFFDQTAENEGAVVIEHPPGLGLETLMDEMPYRVDSFRQWMITAETTAAFLDGLEPPLRDWLQERYSVTDLKRLQRYLIAPSYRELAVDAAEFSAARSPPAERSLRDADSLLRSLVFWDRVGDVMDVDFVTQRLWDTQRRLMAPATLPDRPADPAAASAFDGARYLADNKLSEAARAFDAALETSPDLARDTFLVAYPAFVHAARRQTVTEYCQIDRLWWMQHDERAELSAMIDEAQSGGTPEAARGLMICAVAQYLPDRRPQARLDAIDRLIEAYPDAALWPTDQAQWLAKEIIAHHSVLDHDPDRAAFAAALVNRVFMASDDGRAFWDIRQACPAEEPRQWCEDLVLNAAVSTHLAQPKIGLLAAYGFSFSGRSDRLKKADQLASAYARHMTNDDPLAPDVRDQNRQILDFAQANIAFRQALRDGALNDPDAEGILAAQDTFRSLAVSSMPEIALQSYAALTALLHALDRAADALDEAVPDQSGNRALALQLDLLIATGRMSDALEIVDGFSDESVDDLFDKARIRTLAGASGWERTARRFLETNHRYVPYIAMIMFGTKALDAEDEAEQKLQQLWTTITPANWEARLKVGDPSVWQEMLIGYYLGEVERSRLFDPLETEPIFRASEFASLPLSRRGMLTEGLFYEALLLRSRGDMAATETNLRRIRNLGYALYHEFAMAGYLLNEISNGAQ